MRKNTLKRLMIHNITFVNKAFESFENNENNINLK